MKELDGLKSSIQTLVRRVQELESSTKELKQANNMVSAKLEYQHRSVQQLVSSVKDVSTELDAFADFFSAEYQKVHQRLTRLEEHTGL